MKQTLRSILFGATLALGLSACDCDDERVSGVSNIDASVIIDEGNSPGFRDAGSDAGLRDAGTVVNYDGSFNYPPLPSSDAGMCKDGRRQSSYIGNSETINVGLCKPKVEECINGSVSIIQEQVLPSLELCDGLDNNCDGDIDENLQRGVPCSLDTSISYFQVCNNGNWENENLESCPECVTGAQEETYSDTPQTAHVGNCRPKIEECINGHFSIIQEQVLPSLELCDGLDNNCDGRVDDDLTAPSQECTLGTGECARTGLEYKVCNGINGWSSNYQRCNAVPSEPTEEVCDGRDNDCDGETDEQDSCGKIAFTSGRDGTLGIYVMNADGSEQRRLTNNSEWGPVWSPDGTRIAFSSNRDGNPEIYVMNADGSEQRRLTNNPAYDGDPFWSPDGTKIVFNSHRNVNSDIYVMNADGSEVRRLTNHRYGDSSPFWSPDGTRIAFESQRDDSNGDGNLEIYVMNADGSNQRRLTNSLAPDGYPFWSPDGTRIAFESQRDVGNYEINVMNTDGSEQRNLTSSIPAWNTNPKWSPDGTRIAFYSNRDGNSEIYVINADGSEQRNLTNHRYGDSSPFWSPDGTKIVFYSQRDGDGGIYVMNADGSNQRRLTDGTYPVWSP